MMTEYELGKTFFAGARKEMIVEAVGLLETKAGEKRIKVALTMPLSDGKLVGMPGWLGASYDVIGKEDSLLMADKWGHDLKEMTLTIFSTEDSQKATQIAVAPLLNSFQLRRDPQDEEQEELSDVNLHFVAYVTANMELWRYFYGVHRKSIFVRFETTQQELFQEKAEDKQMKLGEDEYEDARRDATSKARDAELARAN
jgi:hypothetical protein